MAGYHCFHLIFEVYLTTLHCHEHIIFLVGVVFADKLIIDPFTYSPEKDENR